MSRFELEPLPPDVIELLNVERECPEPASIVKDRVRSSIATAVNLPPPTPDAAAASSGQGGTGVLSRALGPSIVKGGLIFALGAGSGAGVHAYLTSDRGEELAPPDIEATVPEVPRRALDAPVETTVPDTPIAKPPSTPPRPTAAAKKRSAGRLADSDLAAERSLLQRARMALARDDPREALSALEEHAKRFRHGKLTEERETLAISVLIKEGRVTEARKRATAFKRRFPRSMFIQAVEKALSNASSP